MKIFCLIIISIVFTVCYSYECFEYEYLNEKGECKWCPSGHYCPGDDNKYLCDDGYYSPDLEGECFKCGCDNCYKQDIIDNKTKKVIHYAGSCLDNSPCYPGYGYDEDFKVCSLCPVGHYCTGGYEDRKLCPRNTIARKMGQTECEECPPNQGVKGVHEDCEICPPGEYYDDELGFCRICFYGTITTLPNQTTCIPCREGYRSSNDGTRCVSNDECDIDDENEEFLEFARKIYC